MSGWVKPNSDLFGGKFCVFCVFLFCCCCFFSKKRNKKWIGWVGGIWLMRVFLGFFDFFITWQDPLIPHDCVAGLDKRANQAKPCSNTEPALYSRFQVPATPQPVEYSRPYILLMESPALITAAHTSASGNPRWRHVRRGNTESLFIM